MIKEIEKRIARALSGVRQAFRGVISTVDSDGPVQLVTGEGLAGENVPDVELFQHYGYTSNPPAGTMKINLPLGGMTSHTVTIATEHATYRLKSLKPGELALYTDEGDSIVMARGRVIDLTTQTLNIKASIAVNIDTPTVNMTHQLSVTEKITGQGGLSMSGGDGAQIDSLKVENDAVIGGKSFNGHRHPETGSTTLTPI